MVKNQFYASLGLLSFASARRCGDATEVENFGHLRGPVKCLVALLYAALTITIAAASAANAQTEIPAFQIVREEALELTLRQSIEMGLSNNLDIRIDRYDLDTSRLRIQAARGYYDPLFGVTAADNSSTIPTNSILQGEIGTESTSGRTVIPSLQQNLPFGGSFSVVFSNARTETSNPFSLIDPLYASNLSFSLRQPLLRGSLRNSTGTQLRILNLDSKISESDFRRSVSEVVQRIHDQYWNLVYAHEAYKARVESRELAVNQSSQIGQKVQAGLLTPVALTSARAEVAIRDQEVIQAEFSIVAAENNLKRLLAGDPTEEIWRKRIVPTDLPQMRAAPASLDEAMEKALRNRPEIQILDLQLKENKLQRSFLRWETLPQLDLIGSYGSVGAAGIVYQPVYGPGGGVVPIGRVPLPSHPGFGDFSKAWDQVLDFLYPSWSVGLNMQITVFNRTKRAQLAEAEIDRRRLETGVKQQQQAIMVEVANAFEGIALQRKAVEVAQLARELSQEQVKGETARFEAGFTTNFEVVRYQRDLAEARVRELRATVDYEIALAALHKAMNTIVDEADLVLANTR